jgi:hypothetical protein
MASSSPTASPTRATTGVVPSAAPTSPPLASAAPGTPACAIDRLSFAFVSTGSAAGTAYPEFGLSNAGTSACALSSPPTLRLEDAAGNDLGIPYMRSVTCDGTNAPYCVTNGTLELPPGGQRPAASPASYGQLPLTVAIASISLILPCAISSQAHTVALSFAGTSGDVRAAFPADMDISVQTCHPQVTLFRFSPGR